MIHFKLISFLLLSGLLISSCANKKESNSTEANISKNEVTSESLPIAQILAAKNYLPVSERIALYHSLKKDNPKGHDLSEASLNIYGYSLLWDNKTEEALEIFKLVVSEHPKSSNAYDSLGEAYLKLGEKKLALKNYEKSFAMNPDNFGAEDQIERIKFPDIKPLEPFEKFGKKYTVQEYRDDLDQYQKKLIEVHPAVFKFISKNNFEKLFEEKKESITENTTYAEFAWHCSEIISSINCSHTSTGSFYPESKMLQLQFVFPVQTRWLNDKLYVVDSMNNADRLKIGDEILTINEVPVKEIVENIYKHISSQGEIKTTKRLEFNIWSTEMIPYALRFPESYSLTIKGGDDPIALKKATKFIAPYDDPSIKRHKEELKFESIDNDETGILTISSFNFYPFDNRIELFEDFMDQIFSDLKKNKTKNLIIDVRFNGGGSSESAMYLLRYLMDKPFKYISSAYTQGGKDGEDSRKKLLQPKENKFKGKIYFLIDGHGNSTTGHFMSLAKVHKLGIIIGEELGSNQFCSAGQTPCRLSNTKLMFFTAMNVNLTTATSLPLEKGILPDHYVTQNLAEYLNHVDVVKEFAIQLTKK